MLLLLVELSLARVTPDKRKFVSNAVDNAVTELKSKMKDAALAQIFENAYPNTLDTTIYSFKVFINLYCNIKIVFKQKYYW